ncbi:MAG: hypothetical protein C5B48_14290 [Candidatus Rokuibacteriota bacterium]|nr:MAG: hypothetical protein C5B48_14290 [Candidatus Rokubacteria bacterium]
MLLMEASCVFVQLTGVLHRVDLSLVLLSSNGTLARAAAPLRPAPHSTDAVQLPREARGCESRLTKNEVGRREMRTDLARASPSPVWMPPTVNRVLETDGDRVEGDLNGRRTVVIPLEGELDIYAAPEIKGKLMAALEPGTQRVVVDLSSASFIDSTMLGILLSTAKRLRAADGELAVVCTNPSILKLLEITLLDRIFPVYDDCGEALRGDSLEPEPSDGYLPGALENNKRGTTPG